MLFIWNSNWMGCPISYLATLDPSDWGLPYWALGFRDCPPVLQLRVRSPWCQVDISFHSCNLFIDHALCTCSFKISHLNLCFQGLWPFPQDSPFEFNLVQRYDHVVADGKVWIEKRYVAKLSNREACQAHMDIGQSPLWKDRAGRESQGPAFVPLLQAPQVWRVGLQTASDHPYILWAFCWLSDGKWLQWGQSVEVSTYNVELLFLSFPIYSFASIHLLLGKYKFYQWMGIWKKNLKKFTSPLTRTL